MRATTRRLASFSYAATPLSAHQCPFVSTLQGHLVGVITNGTAVLGLGNIGALAGAAGCSSETAMQPEGLFMYSKGLESRFVSVWCAPAHDWPRGNCGEWEECMMGFISIAACVTLSSSLATRCVWTNTSLKKHTSCKVGCHSANGLLPFCCAGKPVMEGKAVLFKKFADLDAFDLEVSRGFSVRMNQ